VRRISGPSTRSTSASPKKVDLQRSKTHFNTLLFDTSNSNWTTSFETTMETATTLRPAQIQPEEAEIKKVLSIQSTVVSGYVGNKAAVFPLQLLGFDVDILSTVQLSNHTSYPCFKGDRFTGEQIDIIMQGLEANGLLQYTYILAGYLGTPSTLPVISKWIKMLKADNPNMVFVLDPVMGDNGKLYVSEQHVALYRDELLSLADVVLPNGFEAEVLTGVKIVDEASARLAVKKLHEAGPLNVAITSVVFPSSPDILFFGSTKDGEYFGCTLPHLPVYFSGTGDLLAGLILGHLDKNSFKIACLLALSTTQAVLQETFRRMPLDPSVGAPLCKAAELAIVASRNLILHPHSNPMPKCLD
jgi:pyridoxine kinase